jgi:YceI-like domain
LTELGPENGTLTVHTKRTGAIARAGHDLELEVTRWEATFEPAAMTLAADSRSLHVRHGRGGITPLGDEEKAAIRQSIDDEVLKGTAIMFRSTRVDTDGDRLIVHGELELSGHSRPVDFELRLDDGRLTGRATIKQTDWRMKPFTTLFGTLKVADAVEVEIDATLPKEP